MGPPAEFLQEVSLFMSFWGYNDEEEAKQYWPDFIFDLPRKMRKSQRENGEEYEITSIEFGKEVIAF